VKLFRVRSGIVSLGRAAPAAFSGCDTSHFGAIAAANYPPARAARATFTRVRWMIHWMIPLRNRREYCNAEQ